MTSSHETRGALRAALRALQASHPFAQEHVRAAVRALAEHRASTRTFRVELTRLGFSRTQVAQLIKILDLCRATLAAALSTDDLARHAAAFSLAPLRLYLHPEGEWGPFMTRLARTLPDLRAQAMALAVGQRRAGPGHTLLRLRVSETQGLPVAHRASCSDYGGWEEDVTPTRALVDVALRDEHQGLHVVLATSNLEDLQGWPIIVATAVRNGLHLGLDPFQPGDHLASLTFVSPSLTTGQSQREVVEPLTLLAMLGAMASPRTVDHLDALRYDHVVLGGPSREGLALQPQELVEQAAHQVVAAARVLREWPAQAVPGEPLNHAGVGLLLRYAAGARPILQTARDDFEALVRASDHDPYPAGQRILERLDRDYKPASQVQRPTPAEAQPILDRMQRDRVFEEIQHHDWDSVTEARMAHARDHASTPIWNEMVRAHRSRARA